VLNRSQNRRCTSFLPSFLASEICQYRYLRELPSSAFHEETWLLSELLTLAGLEPAVVLPQQIRKIQFGPIAPSNVSGTSFVNSINLRMTCVYHFATGLPQVSD